MSETSKKGDSRHVILRSTQSGQVSWVSLRSAEIEGIQKSTPRVYDVLLVTDDATEAGKCWAEHNS